MGDHGSQLLDSFGFENRSARWIWPNWTYIIESIHIETKGGNSMFILAITYLHVIKVVRERRR